MMQPQANQQMVGVQQPQLQQQSVRFRHPLPPANLRPGMRLPGVPGGPAQVHNLISIFPKRELQQLYIKHQEKIE